jgi:hypothetical protein
MSRLRVRVVAAYGLISAGCSWAAQPSNDPKLEDQVAERILQLREQAGLPKLTRIKHSKELEQLTCTTAVEDGRRRMLFAFKTSDPVSSAQLNKFALWPPPHKGEWGGTRFAVAVWPARRSGNEPQQYWVGVKKYLGVFATFIDYTLTDDIGHQNDWKKAVNPDCKHVK